MLGVCPSSQAYNKQPNHKLSERELFAVVRKRVQGTTAEGLSLIFIKTPPTVTTNSTIQRLGNYLLPSSGELKTTSNQINHHKTNTSIWLWLWTTLQISQFSDRHFWDERTRMCSNNLTFYIPL